MKKGNLVTKTIGILSIYTMINWGFAVTPILATMFNYYGQTIPYATIAQLSAIQSLAMVPSALLCGAIAGTKVKYKTLIIIGMLMIVIGGIAPAWFLNNFPLILVCRFVNGFGMGFAFSIGPTMINMTYHVQKRSWIAGAGSIVMGLTGMLYGRVAGVMGSNVHTYWYMHLIGLIPLVLAILFLKEPPAEEIEARLKAKRELKAKKDSKVKSSKKFIPRMIWVAVAEFLIFMFFYMTVLGLSNLLNVEGIGDLSTSATMTMLYSLGGLCGGLTFTFIYGKLKRFTLPVALVIWAAATGVFCIARTPATLGLCMFFSSFAVNWNLPCVPIDFGKYVPPESQAFASGLFNSGMNFGCFLTAPLIGLIGNIFHSDSIRLTYRCAFVVVAVVAVIWIIIELRKSADKLGEEVKADEAEFLAVADAMKDGSAQS